MLHRVLLCVSAALLVAVGCGQSVFFCQDDDECFESGRTGTCEANGLCSFEDAACESGQRYSELAGSLAGQCVNPSEDETGAPSTQGGTGPTLTSGSSTSIGTSLGPTSDGGTEDPSSGGEGMTTSLSGMTSTTTSTTETSAPETTDGPPEGALGAGCKDSSQCMSGHCHPEGICSECQSDADCEDGCTPPIPDIPTLPHGICNNGGPGEACETVASCNGASHCSPLAELPGGTQLSVCSSCRIGQNDCSGGGVCGVVIGGSFQTAELACLSANSQPDGAPCYLYPPGDDDQCTGVCGPVEAPLSTIGLCGECRSDADCEATGEACTPGALDLQTLVTAPSRCE